MKTKNISVYFLVFFAVSIIAAPFLLREKDNIYALTSSIPQKNYTIVIDAGHGGEDGGAVALDGSPEKDINLAIALKTDCFLNFLGFETVLTRNNDSMTCDEGLKSQREKKVSDIKNRLILIEKTNCLCSVSIHQNFFGGKASGAQIFYSKNNPQSKLLAEFMQKEIKKHCQPENERIVKQATKDIYILDHTTKPAVLAECGFISNESDLVMLKDEKYQKGIALAISISVIRFSD